MLGSGGTAVGVNPAKPTPRPSHCPRACAAAGADVEVCTTGSARFPDGRPPCGRPSGFSLESPDGLCGGRALAGKGLVTSTDPMAPGPRDSCWEAAGPAASSPTSEPATMLVSH